MEEAAVHYVEKADLTVCWPKNQLPSTILEFNTYDGMAAPSDPELALRRHVFMECAHDAILAVCALLEEGDVKALAALMLATAPPEGMTGVLGYDFVRRVPRVLLYSE